MERTWRWCWKCEARTDQWRSGIFSGLAWWWVLLELALIPLGWIFDPWKCELCEARDLAERRREW